MHKNKVNVIPAFDYKWKDLSRLFKWDFDQVQGYAHVPVLNRIEGYREQWIDLLHFVNLEASRDPWSQLAKDAHNEILKIMKNAPEWIAMQIWWWIRSQNDIFEIINAWEKLNRNIRIATWTWFAKWKESEVKAAIREFWTNRLVVDLSKVEWWKLGVSWWAPDDSLTFEDWVKKAQCLWFEHAVVTDKSRDCTWLGANLDAVAFVMNHNIHSIVSWWIAAPEHFQEIIDKFHWNTDYLYWVITWKAQLDDPSIVANWQKILSQLN